MVEWLEAWRLLCMSKIENNDRYGLDNMKSIISSAGGTITLLIEDEVDINENEEYNAHIHGPVAWITDITYEEAVQYLTLTSTQSFIDDFGFLVKELMPSDQHISLSIY